MKNNGCKNLLGRPSWDGKKGEVTDVFVKLMSHCKWSSQIVVPSVFIIYYIRSGSNHQKMTRFNPPSAAQKCQDSLYQGLQVLWLSDIRTGSLQKSNMAWKIISKTSKKPFSAGISHHVPSMFDDTEMPKWVVMGTPKNSHPIVKAPNPEKTWPDAPLRRRQSNSPAWSRDGHVAHHRNETDMKMKWKFDGHGIYIYI